MKSNRSALSFALAAAVFAAVSLPVMLAPGVGFSVFSAIKEAAKLCLSNVTSYLTQTPVLAILLLASVFIVYPVLRKRAAGLSKRSLLALLPAGPILYYAAVFPYVLAAPGQGPPARVYFVFFSFSRSPPFSRLFVSAALSPLCGAARN